MKALHLLLLCSLISLGLAAQTFNGTGGAIPDAAPAVAFNINVSGLTPANIDTIFGLETVCININHTYDGDLSIKLRSPDGTLVDLSLNNGYGGHDYVNTCFDGQSTVFISTGGAPFTGTYKPQGILGAVNNHQNANGVWKLVVSDDAGGDVGSVISWHLTFGNNPAHPFVFTSTNIPLLILNTSNVSIPDEPKIHATLGIVDNVTTPNFLTDTPNGFFGNVWIEKRGSSSQSFPQKSYGFITTDAAGLDSNVVLLGMPQEHTWILYAPYDDKTLVRNILTYDIARQMGHFAPRTKLCELFLNGQYQGVYVLMEKIKRDLNRVDIARLNTSDNSGDALTGGYIIKIDKPTGSNVGGWTSPHLPAVSGAGQTITFQYDYPETDSISPTQINYIQNYVDSFENNLATHSLYDTVNGYRRYMDENSFIDYFILNEASKNVDGYRLSTFLYKDRKSRGGKLHAGPAWDFNLAWWNANYCAGDQTDGWAYKFGDVCGGDSWQIPFWWDRLMSDTLYQNRLHCRWLDLREAVLDTTLLFHEIDSLALYVDEAQARHFEAIPILGVYTWPNPLPLPTSYAGEINALKDWIRARLAWMDDSLPGNGPCHVPVSGLGIQSKSELNGVSVSPNPTRDGFSLDLGTPTLTNVHVELFSVVGLRMQEFTISKGSKNLHISTSELTPGCYFLKVSSETLSQTIPVLKVD